MPKNSPSLSTYTTMMRVNSKGRPYAKDLNDLFSALLIQQPLSDHRSLFRNYPSTFTTDEAVESLGQLQFTHLVSTPNPLDPSHPILTRTTTTFSMSRDMAKTLGQHFINARLAENATDPQNRAMKDRGIWSPTPKGKFMIQDFSQRARVSINHMQAPLSRIHNFQIVQFERLLDDDQISFSRPNMTQAFKIMMDWLPTKNIMIDDIGGVDSFDGIESFRNSFYGYQCFEWIMEYTSVVSNDEAESVAAEFLLYGWIQQVVDKSDKDLNKKNDSAIFKTGRKMQYYLTDKGRCILDGDTHTLKNNMHSSGGGASMAYSRSRTQSSTSSSNSSIMTSNTKYASPMSKTSSRKEEHVSRLLPTTEESELPNDEQGSVIVPKAIITKQKTTSALYDSATVVEDYEPNVPSIAGSVLQIDNSSCDFGFSSASSTTSSTATSVYQASSLTRNNSNRNASINNSNENIVQEHLEKLRFTSNASIAHQQCSDAPNSQNARLQNILKDPLIRMYFRQFLKSNFCEENINFWVEYTALLKKIGHPTDDIDGESDGAETKRQSNLLSLPDDLTESLLKHCCIIYNTYFCPQNAPSELNIDHGLRYDIIQYMQATFIPTTTIKRTQKIVDTPAPGIDAPFGSISVSSYGLMTSSVTKNAGFVDTASIMKPDIKESPQACLCKIMNLYDLVNDHVCKTMAQDSVPRFIKTQKYHDVMQSYYQTDKSKKDKEEVNDSESTDDGSESDD